MTHGQIWLPINPQDEDSKMLLCEAWSDGYLNGVGMGTWSSSANIVDISRASILFAGSPFFCDPITGEMTAKEGDYLIEGIYEVASSSLDDVARHEALVDSAQEALELIESGNIDQAQVTEFGKMPLEEKLELGLGINARIESKERAWASFCDKARVLSSEQAASTVALFLTGASNGLLEGGTNYFWRDGKFYAVAVLGERQARVVMPLGILLAALGEEKSAGYNMMNGYLTKLTAQDAQDLELVFAACMRVGVVGEDRLFGGGARGVLTALKEKIVLAKVAPKPQEYGLRQSI